MTSIYYEKWMMSSVIIKNLAPLVALFLFVLGNGLFPTYLAHELVLQNASAFVIGMMSAFLYAGLVLGSFKLARFIHRVAHIRAYAAFASIIAISPLLHMLPISPKFSLQDRAIYVFEHFSCYSKFLIAYP